MLPELSFIFPDLPLPDGVHIAISTRQGGVSQGPWQSLNLGDHVGDDPAAVATNRQRLRSTLDLPAEPLWLRQVHGTQIVSWEACSGASMASEADGAIARTAGAVLAVLTADCLPVLACSRDGQAIMALHAGWRGLAAGILEAGITALQVEPAEILVYLGPAIGPGAFEVGPELRQCFVSQDPGSDAAFRAGEGDRYWADIYALARRRLRHLGVREIFGGEYCTVTEAERFFSYRRDGCTGRMASLIWREGL
ncbi:peptidoglycan editing factor PgeF [Acidithiobacillus sp. AMEEHan]|uniref:peptidoglycan editing factor PgeF n=1 Tax=Acidithiobacillus sp. AMEEHan TaxID=2994951 RepID=UPI0027E46319|nr:peptidoglycan editing factor PgeF [Acidithiobacillus sp. AMEEHan]